MQISTKVDEINVNSVLNFFFALRAPESKRQYPNRFEKFLDYLKLEGTFEDKALSLYKKSIDNHQWLTNKLVEFAQYQKQRAQKGEIQNLNRNNALFILDFNDKMQGKDPITGKEKTIKNINAIALFNKSQHTIDFNSGSSLALSAVLKS